MPSFKQTPHKNIKLKKKITTLDEKHKEIISEFERAEREQLPKLKNEKKRIIAELEILTKRRSSKREENTNTNSNVSSTSSKEHMEEITKNEFTEENEYENDNEDDDFDNSTDEDEIDNDLEESTEEVEETIPRLNEISTSSVSTTSHDIHRILDLTDRLEQIKHEINTIKNGKKKYLLENSKYIFDYFEGKKNISKDLQPQKNKPTIVDTFFKIKKPGPTEPEKKSNNIVSKYFNNIDISFMDMSNYIYPTDICRNCHNGELIAYEDEGILICNCCSANVPYLVESEKPTYKEPPKEVCFYAYKRINHFKEIIAQFQGKETTQIHPDIINTIKQQIKKERVDLKTFTNEQIKEMLKKLGLSKYYEHIPFIKDKLGIKPKVMSQELEETLFNLFVELQGPYSKYCPDERVNFLNYYYTAYKLCELLDETQYLSEFPMLKDREKIIEQDRIWKLMCAELGFEFIPTI